MKETLDGYTVVRSDRKTVGITVKQSGEVVIRAPRRMPLAELQQIVEKHRGWILRTVERQQNRSASPDAQEQEALRRKAYEVLPGLVEYWAKRIGVTPASVKITSARTRHGSCSGKNRICFSLFLMQYPPEAVEYVVVHELCHILHHDHSNAFWAAVERYLPDYRARQNLLNP